MSNTRNTSRKQKSNPVKAPEKTLADLKAEAFVRELKANSYNGAKAYKATIGNSSMSTEVASVSANRLLKKDKVQALLAGTAEKAKKALDKMVADERNYKHFEATKLALAYEYGTPVSKSENVNVNLTLEDILLG
jgi:hypothetical protein